MVVVREEPVIRATAPRQRVTREMQPVRKDLNNVTVDRKMSSIKPYLMVLLVVMLPLFFFGGPDDYSPRSYRNFWNLGHVVFFALLSYLLLADGRIFKNKSSIYKLSICLLITSILGILIEILQSDFGRDFDLNDFLMDIIGALIGFSLSPLSINILTRYAMLVSLAAFLLIKSIPWFQMLADEMDVKRQFPILSDFESAIEATRWSGDAKISTTNEVAFSGKHSLRVDLGTSEYSGIILRNFPKNWSDYQALTFEIYNPDGTLEISVRLHDQAHTHYRRKFTLSSGWNPIKIEFKDLSTSPEVRKIALESVDTLGIYVNEQQTPRTIFIDSVELAKLSGGISMTR